MNIHELNTAAAAAAAAEGMLPALQHIVMLKSSTLARRNTFQPQHTKMPFICQTSSPETSGGGSAQISYSIGHKYTH